MHWTVKYNEKNKLTAKFNYIECLSKLCTKVQGVLASPRNVLKHLK